jgi:ketosteroid isomerase-like protein
MAHDSRETVLAYIAAAQRARESRNDEDWSALRALVADDLEIRVASPWAEDDWRLVLHGGDAVVARLQEPINTASSITTENTTVLADGDLVFVEQRSTLNTSDGPRVSAVGHLFRVADGRVSSISTFRNDHNAPWLQT